VNVSDTDPLTGFGTRTALLDDLTRAVADSDSESQLAVFDLVGSDDYLRLFGERTTDALITRLAEEFARVIHPNGSCHRPRYGEFCALVRLASEAADALLEDAASALRAVGESSLISVCYGVARLPGEADDAIEALIIADQQLDLARMSRERRERRDPSTQSGR
jgi:GGDEF domain-containing protein